MLSIATTNDSASVKMKMKFLVVFAVLCSAVHSLAFHRSILLHNRKPAKLVFTDRLIKASSIDAGPDKRGYGLSSRYNKTGSSSSSSFSGTVAEKSSFANAALEKYCLNVNLYIEPSRREEFLTVLKNNAKGTLSTEERCLQYSWGESVDSPNTFHFHEAYIGKEGFEYHTNSPHFQAWEKFASSEPSPFSKAPEVVFFKTQPNENLSKRIKAKQLVRRTVGAVKAMVMAIIKFNYIRAIRNMFYNWFLFFEQFDPNPITEEGKKRKARRQAIERGEVVKEEEMKFFPSFTGW